MKISGNLWQHRNKPAPNNDNGNVVVFNVANVTITSFKLKEKIIDKADNNDAKDV